MGTKGEFRLKKFVLTMEEVRTLLEMNVIIPAAEPINTRITL